ncbi:protein cordon-bleu isoform X2 [Magallana gigas]|uniref:protein cordon-bleu isoform X2 n=1 Tax=Magallana gigas TaxID=29159 RepID=UPI0033411D4F
MSLSCDVSEDSAGELGVDTGDDTSSYHGSCELSDSQEDLCGTDVFRRGSNYTGAFRRGSYDALVDRRRSKEDDVFRRGCNDAGALRRGSYDVVADRFRSKDAEAFRRRSNDVGYDSRAMSLTKPGPDSGGPLTKKTPLDDFRGNGRGPHPLSYPSEPPDDENMNEITGESVGVVVYLPNGKTEQMSVDSNIPMMDLLVNLAAGSRLNPAGHTLQVLNEETGKLKEYKANQTIGSLCTRGDDHRLLGATVQIVPKKDSKKSTHHKNAQPFEMTKRFTVNLPGGQKKVLRISPQLTLEQVRAQLCQERQLDPSRLVFQLPTSPGQQLSLGTTISELPANEVNLVSANVMLDGAKSMPDLSIGRSQSMKTDAPTTPYMPMAGEGKKKKGFFSFLKKDKKFTVSMQADLNHAGKSRSSSSSRREGGSPPAMRKKTERMERPKSMYVTSTADVAVNGQKTIPASSSEFDVRGRSGPSVQVKSAPALSSVKEVPTAGPPVKSGKKKRAPPPPQQVKAPPNSNVVTAEITVESKQTTPLQADSRIPEITPSNQQLAHKFHSRNSSDSSGYHELTLSGAESPDTAKIEENLELQISTDLASGARNKHSGDSGIQDMSSPRRKVRPGIDNLETGSSQTLPLDKTGKKENPRSQSLERTLGAKKKKAPPPPPGHAPPSEPLSVSVKATIPKPARKSSDSTAPAATSSPRPASMSKKDDTLAIHAVLDDLDNHLGDDLENHLGEDLEEGEDQMMMVENGDLTVEEVDTPRPLKPCFVAPPPPDEPPPEDGEVVSYSDIMGVKVDTVDIGTETSDDSTSFDQESPKSSPTQSRAESRTSMASVTTIDEINMGFELAILAGQEAMLEESSEEDEEEYKNEMAHFVERMNKEVVNQKPAVEAGSNQTEPDSEPKQKISVQVAKLDFSSVDSSPCESPRENKKSAQRDSEVSEITYSFTVDSVPPGFQETEEAKGQQNDVKGQEEEEEEEYSETITEVIYPLSSSSDGPGSPRRIPDLDSPKEHVKPLVENPKETVKAQPQVPSQETATKQAEVEKPKEVKQEKEKPKEVKHEKEEFVLTFDDLQNVDFTGPKKKKPQSLNLKTDTKPPGEEVKRRSGRKSPAVVTSPVLVLEELRSRFRSDGDENVLLTPLKKSGSSIKDRCNELSFTPSSEGEQEHVMEEKSISLMALPIVKSSERLVPDNSVVEKLDLSKDVTDGLSESKSVANNEINEDSVNNNEPSQNDSDSAPSSARDSLNYNSAPSSARGSVSSMDVGPMEQMQQQIQVWQTQLEQNQNLLASQPVPTDENSIQLQNQLKAQIEIQKQMLAQMQKSMETLAAQATSVSQDSPRNSMEPAEQSAIPAPIPSPPMLPQMRMKSDSMDKEKKAKKRSSKKFEPKLDPREELMIQIRGFQGRGALKKVQLKQTKWVSGPGVTQ